MKRRAILIEASNVKGQRDLPGARVDVKNYIRYLTSASGGYWHRDEIRDFNKPSASTLYSEIKDAELNSEYLFILFSGHGYMKKAPINVFPPPTEKERTMLCLNDLQEISLSQINPNIKNFVIVDSCREIEKMAKAMKFEDMLFEEAMSKDLVRNIFDDAVREAGAGQIIAYSCGVNEAADEDPNRGGYFAAAMIDSGISLTKIGIRRAITTDQVFEAAFKIVKGQAAQQNPQYLPGRRLRHFPFAVKA